MARALVVALLASARSAGAEPLAADKAPVPDGAGDGLSVYIRGSRTTYAAQTQVTGTRDEQPLRDLPQALTVVTRQLLDDTRARRTDDVLAFVPGVQIYHGSGGPWDDYCIRGFRAWAGTTYRNGYLNGYSGPSATDAVNVERIEVIRGPGSSLYGPSLPGGSINFITKRPLSVPRLTFLGAAGSFESFRAELDATGPVGEDLRYRLTGSADRTAGYRDFNESRRLLVNPVLDWDLGPRTSLLIDLSAYQNSYRSDPMGVPMLGADAFALPVERSLTEPALPLARIEGGLLRLELTHHLSSRWTLKVGSQDKVGAYREKALYGAGLGADGRTLSRTMTNWRSDSADTSMQLAVIGHVETGPIGHALVVGSDYAIERVTWRTSAADPAAYPDDIDVLSPAYGKPLPPVPLPSTAPNRWSYYVAGVYLADTIALLPQLKLVAGARADAFEQSSRTSNLSDRSSQKGVSPRIGLVGEPLPELSLYVSVNSGYWPSLGVTSDGSVLDPERAWAYEAGTRVAVRGDRLTLDASIFQIDNRDIAVANPANPSFQVQLGEARSRGLEMSATARVSALTRLIASYAYTDAHVTANPFGPPGQARTPLALTARHSGATFIQVGVPVGTRDALSLGVGAVFTGERELLDRTAIPGYARLDSVLSYRHDAVATWLRVENLADARYVRAGTTRDGILQGAPRNAMLFVQASFL